MLSEITINEGYESETDNILTDFYIPALENSKYYWRMSGYFSAAAIFYAAQGFVTLLNKGGDIRLVLGHQLAQNDFDAISEGVRRREVFRALNQKLELDFS